MIDILGGNTEVYILFFLGVCIGVIGGFSSSFEEAREVEPLRYRGAWTQVCNRLLFVMACIVCLFVDFPNARETGFNWILFPILGLVMLGVSWSCAFWAIMALKAIIGWIFASITDKLK